MQSSVQQNAQYQAPPHLLPPPSSNDDLMVQHIPAGSEFLSWKDRGDKEEVDIFIVGRLGKADLERARTDYNDPFYRLELLLEPETLSALRNLVESGPLTDSGDVNYPFLGRTAIFSAKLRTLQKSEGYLSPLLQRTTMSHHGVLYICLGPSRDVLLPSFFIQST
jgi:hypothetical protein